MLPDFGSPGLTRDSLGLPTNLTSRDRLTLDGIGNIATNAAESSAESAMLDLDKYRGGLGLPSVVEEISAQIARGTARGMVGTTSSLTAARAGLGAAVLATTLAPAASGDVVINISLNDVKIEHESDVRKLSENLGRSVFSVLQSGRMQAL